MSKDRVDLPKTYIEMLQYSASHSIPLLSANKKMLHVRESSFTFYDPETKEEYQVHVMVTRDKTDFLKPWQIEQKF